MAKQVGPATASGSAAGPGASAPGTGTGASLTAGNTSGQEAAPFISQVPGTPVTFPSFHGRPISWFAVSVIMVAFLIGGLALVFGPIWWLFWASLGLAAVGLLLAMAVGTFDDWY